MCRDVECRLVSPVILMPAALTIDLFAAYTKLSTSAPGETEIMQPMLACDASTMMKAVTLTVSKTGPTQLEID